MVVVGGVVGYYNIEYEYEYTVHSSRSWYKGTGVQVWM